MIILQLHFAAPNRPGQTLRLIFRQNNCHILSPMNQQKFGQWPITGTLQEGKPCRECFITVTRVTLATGLVINTQQLAIYSTSCDQVSHDIFSRAIILGV